MKWTRISVFGPQYRECYVKTLGNGKQAIVFSGSEVALVRMEPDTDTQVEDDEACERFPRSHQRVCRARLLGNPGGRTADDVSSLHVAPGLSSLV